jgi:hypothetical protein
MCVIVMIAILLIVIQLIAILLIVIQRKVRAALKIHVIPTIV